MRRGVWPLLLILVCCSSPLRSHAPDGRSGADDGAGGDFGDASRADDGAGNDMVDVRATIEDTSVVLVDGSLTVDRKVPLSPGCGSTDVSGAGCTDVQKDPLNCGECGHDCHGAACMAGVCGSPPRPLACGLAPSSLAVDQHDVYWLNVLPAPVGSAGHAQVLRCAIAGCDGLPVTLWDGLYPVEGALAIEQGAAFWPIGPGGVVSAPYGANPGILSCATGGCGGTPTSLATVNSVIWAFTADATSAYWSSFGTMSKCALAGCGGSPTTILDGTSYIHALAVNAKSVFWTDDAGVLSSCPLTGCNGAPTVIGAANAFTSVLAVDAQHVYWIDPGTRVGGGKEGPVREWLDGAVLACPTGGCGGGPTVLASYPSWLGGGALAVDDRDLYWSTGNPSGGFGEIVRCRIDGCGGAPTPIAGTATQDPTPGLAVDAMNVYWTDPGRGAVMVAAK